MENKNLHEASRAILDFHCPRFNELPRVPLYKEQVITYIEDVLGDMNFNNNEKILTPTMLNNYVKQKVVSPPKDKKYNEKHLAYLIVVCILKQVFSLQEICKLINIQIELYPVENAYDFFCVELENSLKDIFTTRSFSRASYNGEATFETEVAVSTIRAFAHKVFIQQYLKL